MLVSFKLLANYLKLCSFVLPLSHHQRLHRLFPIPEGCNKGRTHRPSAQVRQNSGGGVGGEPLAAVEATACIAVI